MTRVVVKALAVRRAAGSLKEKNMTQTCFCLEPQGFPRKDVHGKNSRSFVEKKNLAQPLRLRSSQNIFRYRNEGLPKLEQWLGLLVG